MTPNADVVLAVLAGGEGSRMGRPKGLLRIGNQPILEYLLDRLAWTGPVWLITSPGRERPPGSHRFSRELIDPSPGLGPLRGILTALEQPDATPMIITALDMPLVSGEMLRWQAGQLRLQPEALGVMCRRPQADGGQIEPFPLSVRPEAAPLIRRRIDTNRRSVRGLIDEPGFVALDCPSNWDRRVWLNLNVPADLHALAGLRP